MTKQRQPQHQETENHLDVYANRSILHIGATTSTFEEGVQSKETQDRYRRIRDTLASGFLDKVLSAVRSGKIDFSDLAEIDKQRLSHLVDGISENEGRAVVCLCFLQLAIKAIAPDQSIRLHKGAATGRAFSWVNGVSMRTLDADFTSPFLRDKGLLNLNKFGAMMTRTLAENYPYSSLYKATVRGASDVWISLIDSLESGETDPKLALAFLTALLQNRSNGFRSLADQAAGAAQTLSSHISFETARDCLAGFINDTTYSARAMEVVMHGLAQALQEVGEFGNGHVRQLSQMRTANKKAGSIADIEVVNEAEAVVEAWDAKYGKPYLWDELVELGDKLEQFPSVERAGFVVDSKPDLRADILDRKREIERRTGAQIHLMSFSEWVRFQCGNLSDENRMTIAGRWLLAVAETFGRKRLEVAPIDEPCETWLTDLMAAMKKLM